MVTEETNGEDLRRSIVRHDASLAEALPQMQKEAVLVVDDDERLCGLLTDGDVRRAFLGGASMESPVTSVMTRDPLTVPPNIAREEIISLMLRKKIRHLPIVDTELRPVGLELLKNQYDESDFAKAVIMAGGKGTRMRPLTFDKPKPLLDIGGEETIIDNVLGNLKASGVKDVMITINYLGEQIKKHVGDGADRDLRVAYVEESKALGTAGALSLLKPRPRRGFIVMNADLLTEMDFRSLHRFHQEEGNDLSVCVRKIKHKIPYGVVSLEGDGPELDTVEEKPEYDLLVNAGIYLLEPKIIDLVPLNQFFDMVSLIKKAKSRGFKVGAFPIFEYWRDIGRHDEMKLAMAERRCKSDMRNSSPNGENLTLQNKVVGW